MPNVPFAIPLLPQNSSRPLPNVPFAIPSSTLKPIPPMKDLSFFLFKNSLGGKMRRGFRTFCNGDGSTSTLNQQHHHHHDGVVEQGATTSSHDNSPFLSNDNKPPTLEEMILELELEEELARRAKLNDTDEYDVVVGRMSCVNNSDILRCARNALNQYPRFSLDGKDAMYRSSFRNLGRKSVCCDHGLRERLYKHEFGVKLERSLGLPPIFAGERVVWCKPGVVAKLMGLEAMPVPIGDGKEKLSRVMKRENVRRRAEEREMQRRLVMEMRGCDEFNKGRKKMSSNRHYCVMDPTDEDGGWPTRRFY